jgi:hypothetical protein
MQFELFKITVNTVVDIKSSNDVYLSYNECRVCIYFKILESSLAHQLCEALGFLVQGQLDF